MSIESHNVTLNGAEINVEVKIIREGTWSDLGVYYSKRYCEVCKVGAESVLDYFMQHSDSYFDDMKLIKSQIV
jgi:hypothetical protein